MSKTRARELARQATRFGYFDNGDRNTARVRCPECDGWVTAYKLAWEGFTQRHWQTGFEDHEHGYEAI